MLTILFYIVIAWLLYAFIVSIVNTIRYGDEEFWPKEPTPEWMIKAQKQIKEEKMIRELKKQEELNLYKKKYPQHFVD